MKIYLKSGKIIIDMSIKQVNTKEFDYRFYDSITIGNQKALYIIPKENIEYIELYPKL